MKIPQLLLIGLTLLLMCGCRTVLGDPNVSGLKAYKKKNSVSPREEQLLQHVLSKDLILKKDLFLGSGLLTPRNSFDTVKLSAGTVLRPSHFEIEKPAWASSELGWAGVVYTISSGEFSGRKVRGTWYCFYDAQNIDGTKGSIALFNVPDPEYFDSDLGPEFYGLFPKKVYNSWTPLGQ